MTMVNGHLFCSLLFVCKFLFFLNLEKFPVVNILCTWYCRELSFVLSAYYGVLLKASSENFWYFVSQFSLNVWCTFAAIHLLTGIVLDVSLSE